MSFNFSAAHTPLVILLTACFVNMIQSFSHTFAKPKAVKAVLLLSLSLSSVCSILMIPESGSQLDRFANQLICSLLLIASLGLCTLASNSFLNLQIFRGEVACLIQCSLIGFILMLLSSDIATLFLGLEFSFIALASLTGFIEPNRFNQEGALKYFILGSVATTFFIFGLAMLYASSGTIDLNELSLYMAKQQQSSLWGRIGVTAIILGFAFKLGLAPFHLWSPDTYESAPTLISAIMTIAYKLVFMSILIRIYKLGILEISTPWLQIASILAGVSIIFGHLLSLVQTSIKRALAYISTSESGYLAIALCSLSTANPQLHKTMMFYLLTYTLATILAFGILMRLEEQKKNNLGLDDLLGLAYSQPWYAFGLTVALLSLAGIPLTSGFVGKYLLFSSAYASGQMSILIVAAIGCCIALIYYFQIVATIYNPKSSKSTDEIKSNKSSLLQKGILAISCALIFLLGTIVPAKAFQIMAPMVKSDISKP